MLLINKEKQSNLYYKYETYNFPPSKYILKEVLKVVVSRRACADH